MSTGALANILLWLGGMGIGFGIGVQWSLRRLR